MAETNKTCSCYKKCTCCAHCWKEPEDLVLDESLYINGYQASFKNADEGLFFVTHMVDGCGTTLAIPAGSLKDLYTGPEYATCMALTDLCDGHCLDRDDLAPCPNHCSMRWVRDILQLLKNHGPRELLEERMASKKPETA